MLHRVPGCLLQQWPGVLRRRLLPERRDLLWEHLLPRILDVLWQRMLRLESRLCRGASLLRPGHDLDLPEFLRRLGVLRPRNHHRLLRRRQRRPYLLLTAGGAAREGPRHIPHLLTFWRETSFLNHTGRRRQPPGHPA